MARPPPGSLPCSPPAALSWGAAPAQQVRQVSAVQKKGTLAALVLFVSGRERICSSLVSKRPRVLKHLLRQVSEVSLCVSTQYLHSLMNLDLTLQEAEKVECVCCTQSTLFIQTPLFSSLPACFSRCLRGKVFHTVLHMSNTRAFHS